MYLYTYNNNNLNINNNYIEFFNLMKDKKKKKKVINIFCLTRFVGLWTIVKVNDVLVAVNHGKNVWLCFWLEKFNQIFLKLYYALRTFILIPETHTQRIIIVVMHVLYKHNLGVWDDQLCLIHRLRKENVITNPKWLPSMEHKRRYSS